jgi:DNA-binding response OmpR family regulator
MKALVGDVDLCLTPKDYALLQFMARNEGRHMSAAHIYESVWGQPMAGDNNALKMAVSRLRPKLFGSGYTVAGKQNDGYCFERE